MRARLRALAREPLVHFLAVGAVLFGVDALRSGAEGSGDEAPRAAFDVPQGPIVVDESVRASLVQTWSQTHAGAPSEAEMQDLVARWIDEEVLYREGLARGLAEHDAEVRRRVASQMAYVLRARIVVPDPTEAEVQAWFSAHEDRFAKPDRIDFTQVFVQGTDADAQARARELLAVLEGGADPAGLGDTFSGGRRFRGRRIEDLAVRFGSTFADGVAAQADGTWALHRSPEGLHLVRVDRRSTGSTPDLASVRDAVVHDWRSEQGERAFDRAVAELRARWEVASPS